MSAARKEVDEPIVDFVWYIGGRHFVEQSGVPNGVKGLTEVQRDDHYIRVAREHFRDRLENGDESCSRESGWLEGILISEGQLGRRLEEYWIDESRTITRSSVLLKTGVIEMGRAGPVVSMFLRRGSFWRWCIIDASFHCLSTVEVAMDLLNKRASGPEKTGAPRRINHAGNKSIPVAVLWSLSRIANIRFSVTSSSVPARLAVVSLCFGIW